MKKVFTHILCATILTTPFFLFAQSTNDIGLKNPLSGIDSISDLILIVTRVARYIAIPFIVIMIMYAGWLFIWAAANAQSPAKAKEALKWTVVGAFVLLSAELIAMVLRNTLNSLS
jgi:hypothetical protein